MQVAERWIYFSCLNFALDQEEQARSGFHGFSSYHLEYSRNLQFRRGPQIQAIFERTLTAPAPAWTCRLCGPSSAPAHGRATTAAAGRNPGWRRRSTDPEYGLTRFKVLLGRLQLKATPKASAPSVWKSPSTTPRRSTAAVPWTACPGSWPG